MPNKKRNKSENISSLQDSMNLVRKTYGDESIFIYGEGISLSKIDSIKSGSYKLDSITGVDGLPKGRIVEIFGAESSGKTTLALHVISEAQKANGKCAFIDAEHALDINYASNIGVNVEDLIISQPDYGEQALSIAEALVMSKELSVIVVDSVAALVPKSELIGDVGDHHIGVQARMMSQALRKLTGIVKKSNTLFIFINQVRSKIGVVFGNPETTSGGNALKFYASVRLDIRRIGSIKKSSGEATANKTRIKVVKNKVGQPFRSIKTEIMFGAGIDKYSELIDIAIEKGVIMKRGKWLKIGKYKWDGKDSLKAKLLRSEKLLKFLEDKAL